MKCPVEVRCIVCQLVFCCKDCRWKHEQTAHDLQYDCPMCRGLKFLCKPQDLNAHFLKHISEEHLPLHCNKCEKVFSVMDDFVDIDKCNSISELVDNGDLKHDEEKFEAIFDKNDQEETGGTVSKHSKTAIITPLIRKKFLVDYDETTDSENEVNEIKTPKTPNVKMIPKTPKNKRQRMATPHVKKFLTLIRQKAVEDCEKSISDVNDEASPNDKTTPSRADDDASQKEMTTPTHLNHLAKLVQAVTTSTPTHPASGGWSMFTDGQGADSPLSEIENAESPAQSTAADSQEPSKLDPANEPQKLKSIIITGSRLRLGSQDSFEKQATFGESNETSSAKPKKVKFADDTVFEQEPKVKRVFRKPKRMLTPGPQKPRFCMNPRFQALINRFENNGMAMARTPVTIKRQPSDSTPPVGDHTNMPRAINFKEESPVPSECSKDTELYKTCVESPIDTMNNAITALSANIAGSLQNCLTSVFKTDEQETEIQFKFTITKKTFVHKAQVVNEEDECKKLKEKENDYDKANIWTSVTKAVKNVLWKDDTDSSTPHRTFNSTSSSASKRKCSEIDADDLISPLNHKRHKYEGRIRCRPPLRGSGWVSSLRTSQSAEQQTLMDKIGDVMNQSF